MRNTINNDCTYIDNPNFTKLRQIYDTDETYPTWRNPIPLDQAIVPFAYNDVVDTTAVSLVLYAVDERPTC